MATGNDLDSIGNTEDDDASDDDYSIKSIFKDISLLDTIVEDNNDESKDIIPEKYYDTIAFEDNSDYE